MAAVRVFGVTRILVDALFSELDPEGNIFFCPTDVPEYLELQSVHPMQWRQRHPPDELPPFVLLQYFQAIQSLEEIWVGFRFEAHHFDRALQVIWKSSARDNRLVIAADQPLPRVEECGGLRLADPTGRHEFQVVGAEDEQRLRKAQYVRGTVCFSPGDFAEYHTLIVP